MYFFSRGQKSKWRLNFPDQPRKWARGFRRGEHGQPEPRQLCGDAAARGVLGAWPAGGAAGGADAFRPTCFLFFDAGVCLLCILLGCYDFNFLSTNGFSIKPPKAKLLEGEQKATEFSWLGGGIVSICFLRRVGVTNSLVGFFCETKKELGVSFLRVLQFWLVFSFLRKTHNFDPIRRPLPCLQICPARSKNRETETVGCVFFEGNPPAPKTETINLNKQWGCSYGFPLKPPKTGHLKRKRTHLSGKQTV